MDDEEHDPEVVWIPCLTLQVLALYYEGLGALPRGLAATLFGGRPEAGRETPTVAGPVRLPPLPDAALAAATRRLWPLPEGDDDGP